MSFPNCQSISPTSNFAARLSRSFQSRSNLAITGAVLIGNGTYSYSPEPGKQFNGQFRSLMLRFNPEDAAAIIKLSAGKSIVDKGAS